jgi:hypothetical protein
LEKAPKRLFVSCMKNHEKDKKDYPGLYHRAREKENRAGSRKHF